VADDQATAWEEQGLRDVPFDADVRRLRAEPVRGAVAADGEDEVHVLVAQGLDEGPLVGSLAISGGAGHLTDLRTGRAYHCSITPKGLVMDDKVLRSSVACVSPPVAHGRPECASGGAGYRVGARSFCSALSAVAASPSSIGVRTVAARCRPTTHRRV
jgi:hypothetical protein